MWMWALGATGIEAVLASNNFYEKAHKGACSIKITLL